MQQSAALERGRYSQRWRRRSTGVLRSHRPCWHASLPTPRIVLAQADSARAQARTAAIGASRDSFMDWFPRHGKISPTTERAGRIGSMAQPRNARARYAERVLVIACGMIAREILAVKAQHRPRPSRPDLPAGRVPLPSRPDRAGDGQGDRRGQGATATATSSSAMPIAAPAACSTAFCERAWRRAHRRPALLRLLPGQRGLRGGRRRRHDCPST